MTLSRSLQARMASGSWIRAMFEEGRRLVALHGAEAVADLSLGNPIVEPPEALKAALLEAAADGRPGLHRYMGNEGLAEARGAVAERYARESGEAVGAEHVVLTCGAAAAINIVLRAILDPGDEVVLIAPYFVEYPGYVLNHGGVVRAARTTPAFGIDAAAVAEAIGERTRALILNSPNNPTGRLYPEADLRALVDALRERGRGEVHLISDEPYARIVYDDLASRPAPPSPLALYERCIVASSCSKELSIPGERLGWAVVSPRHPEAEALVRALAFANRTLGFVNAPALVQRAAARALEARVDLSLYRRNRDRLLAGLVAAGYEVVPPEGAFFLFPRAPGGDDVAFVRRLLDHRVHAVPGTGFGAPGFFRLSYSVEERVIPRAIEGLARAMVGPK